MNFNTITKEQEDAAVAKFNTVGKGVSMTHLHTQQTTWGELINPEHYSMRSIRERMIQIGRTILTQVQDELLDCTDVAFTTQNARGETVVFTHLDQYTFLRAAYRYRKDSEAYKANASRRAAIQKELAAMETPEEKKKRLEAELTKLDNAA